MKCLTWSMALFASLSALAGECEWKFSKHLAKYMRIEGNRLIVDVPAGVTNVWASATRPIDLSDFAVSTLEVSVRCRGEDVVRIPRPARGESGVRLSLNYDDPVVGERRYAHATIPDGGSFDWTNLVLRASFGEVSPSADAKAQLVIGLTQASGRIEYDLSSFSFGKAPPMFKCKDNDYQVRYPGRISSLPRMRGVMGRGNCLNTEQDIEDLKNYGANLIRLQMNGFATKRPLRKGEKAKTLADWNQWLAKNLDHAEEVLGWLEKRDMMMVLDMHNPPLKGYGKDGDVFYVREYAARFIEAWREIAVRFKGRKGIYGYDLMNEPLQIRQALPDCDYWNIQRRAAEAIRTVDPDATIIFAANEWSAPWAFTYLAALEMDNVIYHLHMYVPGGYTHQGANGAARPSAERLLSYPNKGKGWDKAYLRRMLEPVVKFQKRHNAKIFVGEFSACIYAPGAGQYLRDCISLFEEYGWDWTYHSFREAFWWNVETVIDPVTGKPVPNKDNDRFHALIDGFKGLSAQAGGAGNAKDVAEVEKYPYELVRAGRMADETPETADLSDVGIWDVSSSNAVARLTRASDRGLFHESVGRLWWRGTNADAAVVLRLKEPVTLTNDFSFASFWLWGDMRKDRKVPGRPPLLVTVDFEDKDGRTFSTDVCTVEHLEWFKLDMRVPERITEAARAVAGAKLLGLTVRGATGMEGRTVDLAWLSVFQPEMPPLAIRPRAKRGVVLFPGQPQGVNTGEGRLPFPDRETTVLPTPNNDVAAKIEWRFPEDPGIWDDFAFRYAGGAWHRPTVGGGLLFVRSTRDCSEKKRIRVKCDVLSRETVPGGGCRYACSFRDGESELGSGTVAFRPRGHVMAIDVAVTGGKVIEVRFGDWDEPVERTCVPFLTYKGYGRPLRPYLCSFRQGDETVFSLACFDWTQTGATCIIDAHGLRYDLKTDGTLNPCFERLTLAVSPDPLDVMPVVPNPVSPWKMVTGTHVWTSTSPWGRDPAARDRLLARFRDLKRRGFERLVICDHEAMWRDGEESYTFRTEAAPAKGGDAAQSAYTRALIDELGYRYGPYNNFIDFVPLNANFRRSRCALGWGGRLLPTWVRCYKAKPTYGVEASAEIPFILQRKFRFNAGYCDLITGLAPWSLVEADARDPGACSSAHVFYTRGETLLLQKQAWNGPVYSEGGCHFPYCGLVDGSYGQDPGANLQRSPWLVDFTLKRLAPLCCDFGMGDFKMFWREGVPLDKTMARDRFLAATVAFGHSGFLLRGSREDETLSYFMIQAAAARYTQAKAETVRYADADGRLLPLGQAIASGTLMRSQVVTAYSDGTVTAVNGSTNLMMSAGGFVLPPNGYAVKTPDGSVEVFSGEKDGHRIDWAKSPDYALVNGRGHAVDTPVGGTDGLIVRLLRRKGEEEVFASSATFVELPVKAVAIERCDAAGATVGRMPFAVSGNRTRFVPDGHNGSYLVRTLF